MRVKLPNLGIKVGPCGLFISSGRGTHPDRVLNDYELIVVRKGSLSIWENDVRFEVPPGHALVLYPRRRHRGATPFGRDLSFYWIHWVFKQPGKAAGTLEIPQLVRLQRPEYVTELFHRFLDDQASHRLAPYDAALGLLQILSEVGRAPLSATEASGNSLVGRAEAHIIRHMAEPLSTARLARALRINPDYLNRAFRKVHGMTITEYLHRRKLQDAAMLLRESTDSIAEIASACGYGTPVHFRRMFQRFNGVTPRDYRRLHARAFVNAR
ncbi:MAG: AraC family transcriptional regulator [Myxococcales bacterium]|jgi:AraC-like DNA-binding protein